MESQAHVVCMYIFAQKEMYVCMYVPEAASTNSPLMKSLVNLISGTTTPAAGAALPLPLLAIVMLPGDLSLSRVAVALPLTRRLVSVGWRRVLEGDPAGLGLPLLIDTRQKRDRSIFSLD